MNAFVRPTRSAWLTFDEIEVSDNARPYNASDVVTLARSIREIGLMTPLSVVERDGRFVLVAGRHRLEALKLMGADKIPVRVVDFDDVEAKLWRISENLHRTELTAFQRAEQIEEWRKLTAEKVAQVGPPLGGGQPKEGGVRKTAEALGVSRQEVQRASKIASIAPAAKEAVRSAGLSDNQSALLKVASAPTEMQVEEVAKIVQSRAQPAAKASHDLSTPPSLAPMRDGARPLRDLVNISGGELARWIKITTPNDRPHVVRVLRMAADILEAEHEGRFETDPEVAAQ